MLSQKTFDILKLSRIEVVLNKNFLQLSTSTILNNKESGIYDRKQNVKSKKYDLEKLKAEEESYGTKSYEDKSLIDDYIDNSKTKKPFYDFDLKLMKPFHSDIEYTPIGIAKYIKEIIHKNTIKNQMVKEDLFKIMGSDLAAAHFVINNYGKVKFKHIDNWIGNNKDDDQKLPRSFEVAYILTGIDMSDIELYYEGLLNFYNCPKITTAIFQRSPYFDEWFADRLTHIFPNLEHLDLTDCPKLNERVLEAFYKLSNLKTLIVTNQHKTAHFELTCMMLEDVVPGLTVTILEPKEERKRVNKSQC